MIFVEGVGFPEYGEVEEHDGKELARFSKDERYVIDVSERSVSERGGERGSYCHEYEREEDGASWEDGRGWTGLGSGIKQVKVAN